MKKTYPVTPKIGGSAWRKHLKKEKRLVNKSTRKILKREANLDIAIANEK